MTGCDDEEEHHQGRVNSLGQSDAPMHTYELQFDGESPARKKLDIYAAKHPLTEELLACAARELNELPEVISSGIPCDIHAAYWWAKVRFKIKCSRNWLPGYSRKIKSKTGIPFDQNQSQFDL